MTIRRSAPKAGLQECPAFLFGSRKWWVSPYINHFLQPDTIIPDQTSPQSWNRYAYVTNNPLRFTDPTGHRCVEEGEEGSCTAIEEKITQKEKTEREEKRHRKKENKLERLNPIESYCGDISGLACLANLAQDVATLTDLVGVGLIEAPAVADGCLGGGPLGCAVAEVGVIATWTLTLNGVESAASVASFGFTVLDDLINNGGWGENSSTSLTTFKWIRKFGHENGHN